jgi:hypothetical protein
VFNQFVAGFLVALLQAVQATGFIGFGKWLGEYIVADVGGKKDKSLEKRKSCCHEQL